MFCLDYTDYTSKGLALAWILLNYYNSWLRVFTDISILMYAKDRVLI